MILLIIILVILLLLFKNTFYDYVYNCNQFIYNIAWEDPDLDFKYLDINEEDNILMITTAGCNVLNTLLKNPKQIISVDISKCQNALLDLKLSAIKELNYEIFWKMFGLGHIPDFRNIYKKKLRESLQLESSKIFWDKNYCIFTKGLYNSGSAVKTLKYAKLFLGDRLIKLCEFDDREDQYRYYKKKIEPIIFNKYVFMAVNTSFWQKLTGVPKEQYMTICNGKCRKDEIFNFMKNSYDFIFKNRLVKTDNYFAYATIKGNFIKSNCPEYLKEENYNSLKLNYSKVEIVNASVSEYLKGTDVIFTKFILLDHLDWFKCEDEVIEEFNLINKRSKDCVGIFRSGNKEPWYLKHIKKLNFKLENLSFERDNDRLGTYLGFYQFKKSN